MCDPFPATSETAAKKDAENTIRNNPFFRDYAGRVGELQWKESELSEEEWEEKRNRFIAQTP
jgi:hypothetical protein